MPRTEPLQDPPAAGRIPEPDGDIVLADLANAIADYRRERAEWQRDRESFAQMRESLAEARAAESRLTEHVRALQNDVDRARQLAGREHHRAEIMASSLKDIHGALFTGDIYSLILRACLTLAGATRGLYITATHSSGELRIRAAIDVDGYPQAPPSPFIRALCEAVLEGQKTIFCNQDDDLSGLPAPAQESERFRNCLVAPAVLLHDFNGIIIAADKESGTFDDEDEASLLAVGDQAQVAVENVRLHRALEQSYLATVTVLADTIEAKDPYTFGHCEMVSRYALHTARKLGLGDQDQLVVRYSALLHDVG